MLGGGSRKKLFISEPDLNLFLFVSWILTKPSKSHLASLIRATELPAWDVLPPWVSN